MIASFRKTVVEKPIVVLPLAAVALGVTLVPFAVWNTDHAAQFYGSFVAALVAAGAVVGGAQVQAAMTRRRDERLERREHVTHLIGLAAFPALHGGYALSNFPERWRMPNIRSSPTGKNGLEDESEYTPDEIRLIVGELVNLNIDTHAQTAALLKSEVADQVLSSLYGLKLQTTFLRFPDMGDKEKYLDKKFTPRPEGFATTWPTSLRLGNWYCSRFGTWKMSWNRTPYRSDSLCVRDCVLRLICGMPAGSRERLRLFWP